MTKFELAIYYQSLTIIHKSLLYKPIDFEYKPVKNEEQKNDSYRYSFGHGDGKGSGDGFSDGNGDGREYGAGLGS